MYCIPALHYKKCIGNVLYWKCIRKMCRKCIGSVLYYIGLAKQTVTRTKKQHTLNILLLMVIRVVTVYSILQYSMQHAIRVQVQYVQLQYVQI